MYVEYCKITLYRIPLPSDLKCRIFSISANYCRISTVTSYGGRTLNKVWSSSCILYLIQTPDPGSSIILLRGTKIRLTSQN
jgi:hypothetical protein